MGLRARTKQDTFNLVLDPAVRARLEEHVRRENLRLAPARLTKTAFINRAIIAELERESSRERTREALGVPA